MTLLRVAVFASLLFTVAAVSAREDSAAAVTSVTGKFLEAQRSFDLPTIRALTADNYVEISPAGELDDREKMLGFYAPEKKTQAPPLTVENELTRVFGDVAIQTVKLTYTMGEARKMALRATLVAHKRGGEWKLVSAQYTGIRPPPAASK
jgi:ketosteroid isomerase-like protein